MRLERFGERTNVGGDEAVVEAGVGFFELLHQVQFSAFLVLQV